MTGSRRRVRVVRGLCLVALGAAVAGCSSGGGEATPSTTAPASPRTSAAPSTSTSTTPASTTTTRPLPSLPVDGAVAAVTTATGVVAAVVRTASGSNSFVVQSPCGREVTVRNATPIRAAHVVIDPGHGGIESGAVGRGGLKESDVNLGVAQELQRQLAAVGVEAVLTRTGDYRVTLASRARIATQLDAAAFVSIHHNAEPDRFQDTPGTEIYYQVNGAQTAKRLAGLVYEEVVDAFSAYPVRWGAFRDAGVKVRLNGQGDDYYGILRNAAGTPSALVELAYITNPPEEALLATPEFRGVEAGAVARGIVRYLTTDDQGTGFRPPSDRSEPAGPGGGSQGCVDPPLQ